MFSSYNYVPNCPSSQVEIKLEMAAILDSNMAAILV